MDTLDLRSAAVRNISDAERYTVRVRFAQALHRQNALENGDDEAIHAFRLACKRLRFALERIDSLPAKMKDTAELLGRLTDELGFAHDCAELANLAAKNDAPLVCARARRDRDRYIGRARALWRRAFRTSGEFAPLAEYAGFHWSTP